MELVRADERVLGGLATGRPVRRALRAERLRRRPAVAVALAVIFAVALLAAVAPLLVRAGALLDPEQLDVRAMNVGPGVGHLLGTDNLGRDLLSRVIAGARVSLSLALLVQAVALAVAVAVGLTAGCAGGLVDSLLMRVTDVMYAFPDLLFVLVILAVLGPGFLNVVFAIGLVSWPLLARLVRTQALTIREREYVRAAQAMGMRPVVIAVRHVLPNAAGPVLVTAVFGIPGVIFMEAFLSFVGLGIRPPTPSWGLMVDDGYQAVFAYPHEALVPAAAIGLVSLCFNVVGDGLRDAIDPRTRDGA